MKFTPFILILTCILFNCSKTQTKDGKDPSQVIAPKEGDTRIIAAQSEPDTLKGSLKAKAMGTIGNTGITINYYSPAVRGRILWGGLVPFNNVWVTGAHKATSIELDSEVTIGDVAVAPGRFGLFTIPGKEEWIIIINKNWDQHLADDYDQKEDIVRVKVKPEATSQPQERLMYTIQDSGVITMNWGNLIISIPVRSNG